MLNDMGFDNKKMLLIAILIIGALGGLIFLQNGNLENFLAGKNNTVNFAKPLASKNKDITWPTGVIGDINKETPINIPTDSAENTKPDNSLNKEVISILLVGTDSSIGRRERGQRGFNTDSTILVSINQKTKRVLLTSVPRDLWINDNKINALYTVFGEETLSDAFFKITGLKVDRVIRADFDGFKWVIDSFGGVPIKVERSFSDSNFPNNTDSGPITVEFKEGEELMDGERALIFARSRKGTNGEGSDLMRAKRQHLILQALTKAVSQKGSKYWPMDVKTYFEAAQSLGDIYTNMSLADATFLWNFFKDKDQYKVESFVIGDQYLYHPGMYPESPYHAWVFIPREENFATLHKDITAKLEGTFVEKPSSDSATNTENKENTVKQEPSE